MAEFNLLQSFPKVKRGLIGRVVTPETLKISRKQGFDYYDGNRNYGFGGYVYDGRWRAVAELAKRRYALTAKSQVLVERCEKAFLVFDIKKLIPGITVFGSHCFEYALTHAMDGYGRWALINGKEKSKDPKLIEQQARDEVSPFLIKAELNDSFLFKDNFFDTVISINSICNYPEAECRNALREIMRVSKNKGENCYIHTDSWTNAQEKEALMKWVLLCKTFLDTKSWERLYQEEGYRGDWGFTIFGGDNF